MAQVILTAGELVALINSNVLLTDEQVANCKQVVVEMFTQTTPPTADQIIVNDYVAKRLTQARREGEKQAEAKNALAAAEAAFEQLLNAHKVEVVKQVKQFFTSNSTAKTIERDWTSKNAVKAIFNEFLGTLAETPKKPELADFMGKSKGNTTKKQGEAASYTKAVTTFVQGSTNWQIREILLNNPAGVTAAEMHKLLKAALPEKAETTLKLTFASAVKGRIPGIVLNGEIFTYVKPAEEASAIPAENGAAAN